MSRSRLQSLISNIDHMTCSLSSKNSPRNTVDFEAACSVYIRFRGVNGYLEMWHGAVLVERLPRLRGRNQHAINYRHVIDWLVRKPGAFAGYRYQDAMFPTSRFRRAYDALLERSPGRAAKDYLRILDLAAKESETGVDAVLGRLLEWNVPITPTVVADHLAHDLGLPRAMEVTITTVDLSMYDGLLETREDMPLTDQPTCTSP